MIYGDWLIYKGIWQPLSSHPLPRIFQKITAKTCLSPWKSAINAYITDHSRNGTLHLGD
jgi:hypothetical protein